MPRLPQAQKQVVSSVLQSRIITEYMAKKLVLGLMLILPFLAVLSATVFGRIFSGLAYISLPSLFICLLVLSFIYFKIDANKPNGENYISSFVEPKWKRMFKVILFAIIYTFIFSFLAVYLVLNYPPAGL